MNDFNVIEQHKEQINNIACYQKMEGKRIGLLQKQMAEIPFMEGLTVLDAGCNNGLHSLVASKYCPTVVGAEIEHYLYESCLKMKRCFETQIQGYNPDRVTFLRGSIADVKGEFEGVLAFNILYHLDKQNLRRMTEIMQGCQRTVVQSRKKVNKKSAQNNLHQPDQVVKYLEKIGFSCVVKSEASARPIILGKSKWNGDLKT